MSRMPVEVNPEAVGDLSGYERTLEKMEKTYGSSPLYQVRNPVPSSGDEVVTISVPLEELIENSEKYLDKFGVSASCTEKLQAEHLLDLISEGIPNVTLYESRSVETKATSAEQVINAYDDWLRRENHRMEASVSRLSNTSKDDVMWVYSIRRAMGVGKILDWIDNSPASEELENARYEILLKSAFMWVVDAGVYQKEKYVSSISQAGFKIGCAKVMGAITDQMVHDPRGPRGFSEDMREYMPDIPEYRKQYEAVLAGATAQALVQLSMKSLPNSSVESAASREDALRGYDFEYIGPTGQHIYLDVKTSQHLDIVGFTSAPDSDSFVFYRHGEPTNFVDLAEVCKTPPGLIEYAGKGKLCVSVRLPIKEFLDNPEEYTPRFLATLAATLDSLEDFGRKRDEK